MRQERDGPEHPPTRPRPTREDRGGGGSVPRPPGHVGEDPRRGVRGDPRPLLPPVRAAGELVGRGTGHETPQGPRQGVPDDAPAPRPEDPQRGERRPQIHGPGGGSEGAGLPDRARADSAEDPVRPARPLDGIPPEDPGEPDRDDLPGADERAEPRHRRGGPDRGEHPPPPEGNPRAGRACGPRPPHPAPGSPARLCGRRPRHGTVPVRGVREGGPRPGGLVPVLPRQVLRPRRRRRRVVPRPPRVPGTLPADGEGPERRAPEDRLPRPRPAAV